MGLILALAFGRLPYRPHLDQPTRATGLRAAIAIASSRFATSISM
jgi:hypothetical protein